MTNGDKFKEVFEISQVDEGELYAFAWLPNHDVPAEISIDWWNAEYKDKGFLSKFNKIIKTVTPQEPFINKPCVSSGVCEHDKQNVLDEIRAEITDCLKALDEIEKSELNTYLPDEISDRRLMYQHCLTFIDEYKAESEEQEDGKK